MTTLASRPIWFETFAGLISLWYRNQTEAVQNDAGSPAEAYIRVSKRAKAVQKIVNLPDATPLKTVRQWETRWNPAAQAAPMKKILTDWGWDIVIHRGAGEHLDYQMDAIHESDRQALILSEASLQAEARMAVEGGLNIPLTAEDTQVFAICRELYDLAAERMGAFPKPWVDQLARCEFTRVVLGLPFSPLVMELISND